MSVKCMSKKAALVTFWVASGVLVVSITVLLLFPTIYKTVLRTEITLTEGSLMTKLWEDIPLPLYEKLYFFNITNGKDFTDSGAALNVTEVGPYTYVAKWAKKNLQWNSNYTVSYRETRTYHFVREMSVGSEDDSIYTLNGPLIVAADILKKYNVWLRIAASFILKLKDENIITRKTIKELAYGGYEDFIIKFAPLFKPDIPFKNGRFLWLYEKNDTDDGLFTVFTGENNASLTNMIDKFNGRDRLDFWNGETCNMINGTSIETGPPLEDKPHSYTFFQSIFCRSLTLNYTGECTPFDVLTKRFEVTESLFANGSDNPDNACFDLEPERPSGVLDVRPCQFDAPVLLSFPHFYLADSSYLKFINGLSPNSTSHGSYLEVEPLTGISVNAAVRFQINLQLSRTKGIFQFRNVTEGIFPVVWAAIEINLTEDWASFLKRTLNNPKIIVYSVLGILAVLSVVLVVCSLTAIRLSRKADDDDPLLDIKEDEKANLLRRTVVPAYASVNCDDDSSRLDKL